jgi:hypothetical protein
VPDPARLAACGCSAQRSAAPACSGARPARLAGCLLRLQDISSCSVEPPKILAIGGEQHRKTKVNSGVMFINTTAMAHHHYGLIAWGIKNKFPGLFDQTMINRYFRAKDLDQLPDEFNWKVGAYSAWVALLPPAAVLREVLPGPWLQRAGPGRSCQPQQRPPLHLLPRACQQRLLNRCAGLLGHHRGCCDRALARAKADAGAGVPGGRSSAP